MPLLILITPFDDITLTLLRHYAIIDIIDYLLPLIIIDCHYAFDAMILMMLITPPPLMPFRHYYY
jgi:hypothetical protein